MTRLFLDHVVYDVVDFRFQICHSAAIVQDQGYDYAYEHYGQYQTPRKTCVRALIRRLDLSFRARFVALFSVVTHAADASSGRMAGIVTRWAVTRFHTMVSVEPFRTHLVASITHPARIANALSVVFAALGFVLAVTLLIAVHSVKPVRTNLFTVGTGPSGWTLTRSRFMRTLSTVLAGTIVTTFVAIRTGRTRMLTGGPDITRSTRVLSSNVIASCV